MRSVSLQIVHVPLSPSATAQRDKAASLVDRLLDGAFDAVPASLVEFRQAESAEFAAEWADFCRGEHFKRLHDDSFASLLDGVQRRGGDDNDDDESSSYDALSDSDIASDSDDEDSVGQDAHGDATPMTANNLSAIAQQLRLMMQRLGTLRNSGNSSSASAASNSNNNNDDGGGSSTGNTDADFAAIPSLDDANDNAGDISDENDSDESNENNSERAIGLVHFILSSPGNDFYLFIYLF